MDWPRRERATTAIPAARGYHPLLAIAAGTGEVLMSSAAARAGPTPPVALAHFLRETVGRVRYGGARGQLTVRADSGFYAHTVVAACREMDVRFSITIRQRASLRDLIEAIPEEDWTPFPTGWTAPPMSPRRLTPRSRPSRTPRRRRLIVRRVKPTPGWPARPLRQIQLSRLHQTVDGETLELEAGHRRQRRGRERILATSSTASG